PRRSPGLPGGGRRGYTGLQIHLPKGAIHPQGRSPMPRQLQTGDAVDNMWDALVYACSRLKAGKEETEDLASPLEGLIGDAEELWKGQRQVWRAETEAEGGVNAVNFRADARTEDLHVDLTHANHPLGAQGQRRQDRYFPIAKSQIIRLALAAQMAYID